jgi:hypothetical protein
MKYFKTYANFINESAITEGKSNEDYQGEIDKLRDYNNEIFKKKSKSKSDQERKNLTKLTNSNDAKIQKLTNKLAKLTESTVTESYSDEQRMDLAEQGLALSDGSYPIKDLKDLKNAIMAYGRSKDQPRTAKFIVKRAKALGAEDLIPDTEDFQKSLKESKAYKSATRNELAQYIINLQDEIKAYQQKGNKKYAEGSARDLEEVRAELASRK